MSYEQPKPPGPEGVQEALELMGSTNPGRWICTKYRTQIEEGLNYSQIRGALAFEPFMAAVIDDVVRDKATGKGDLWRAFTQAPDTAMMALQMAAQFKLLPGSKYGLIYLIPRRNRGRLEVNAQIGYKGLCAVSTRHDRVHAVEAFLVYEGEHFEFDAGTGRCTHKYGMSIDRSDDKIIGGYMKAIITEEATKHAVIDAPIIWPMSRAEILKRRDCSDAWRWAEKGDKSKGGGKKDSPWHEWFPEMCRKTILVAGLNHGSVPRDMGVGMLLHEEAERDRSEPAPDLPKQSRLESVKQAIGISVAQEPFAFAEDAVQAIGHAQNEGNLRALAGRWQHFTGADAETVAYAFERRLGDLR